MRTLSVDFSRFISPPEALARFLRRVWDEQAKVRGDLAPGPVHDLRVALRRTRSLAEGFSELGSHRDWRQFRKAARRLQGGLAELRDAQVMATWVRRLGFTGGTAGVALADSLRSDERKARRAARSALTDFPRKRWKRWQRRLPQRAGLLAASPASLAGLASQRAGETGACDRKWRKTGSRIAAHRLRIAVKRFRYTVESFLPEQYAAWGRKLKRMQDCLGEIHDLDVLRSRILQLSRQELVSRETLRAWLGQIESTRKQRVERYRKLVSPGVKTAKRGKPAPVLWDRWRHELYVMGWINPLKPAGASESEARAVGPAAEKGSAD